MKEFRRGFLIPLIFLNIAFILQGVYPFGDRSIMICDGLHQYVNFYEKLWNLVSKGKWIFSEGEVFYSSFFGIYAYYLSSPFTIIVLLLRIFLKMNEAVTVVILLKIGCCSCSMIWYLKKRTKLDSCLLTSSGCMYALSDYVLGYYNNLMWLDALIFLPMLTYGIEELVLKGKRNWYIGIFLTAVISNYYTGYMLGIFSAGYFLCFLFQERLERKIELYIRFFRESCLCIAASMIWIIPVVLSLSKTTAGNNLRIKGKEIIYGSILELLQRLNFSSVPVTVSGKQGNANIFCGSGTILFITLYCLNRKIGREKKAMFVLMLVYFTAFWLQPLNLLFHGLHRPIGIPNRFSFIFIFLIILMVSRELEYFEERLTWKSIIAAVLSFCLILMDWKQGKAEDAGIQGSILLIIFILCVAKSRYLIERKIWKRALAFLLILDVGCHTILGINAKNMVPRTVYIERAEEIGKLIGKVKNTGEYRTILASQRLRNEEMLSDLNGMSLYSSSIPGNVLTKMKKLGAMVGQNNIQYKGNSELLDIIFGVRYLIGDHKSMMYRSFYKKIGKQGNFVLFQNDRALKAGNRLETLVMKRDWKGKNPFYVHEEILASAGCIPLYDLKTITGKRINGNRWKACYEIHIPKGEHGYLYLPGKSPKNVKIQSIVYSKQSQNTSFLDLGYAEQNRIIRVYLDSDRKDKLLVGTYPETRLDYIAEQLQKKYGGEIV